MLKCILIACFTIDLEDPICLFVQCVSVENTVLVIINIEYYGLHCIQAQIHELEDLICVSQSEDDKPGLHCIQIIADL